MNLARVVAIHPERHKVDLVFLTDGRRVPGVRVMSGEASSSSGRTGLAKPDAQDLADPYAAPARSTRDLIACVAFYDGQPVVQGFLFPEVSECLFEDLDRVMDRTPSDFYHTVDGKGNAEWFHPSGAYVRIATDPAHEDLKGKDFDAKFNPKRNAEKQVHIHIEQAGGTASINIAPSGAIAIKSKATLQADIDGAVTVNGHSTVTVNADGKATVKAPEVLVDSPDSTFTGKVTVAGLFTYQSGLAGTGAANISGAIAATGDVTAAGVSVENHVHSGVAGGPSTSGAPVK